MNVAKHKNLMLALAVVMMLNFNSCKKYEDGPAFSLKTKNARLTGGTWEVVDIEDMDMDGLEIFLEFDTDGDLNIEMKFSYYGYTYSGDLDGEWEWDSNKEVLEVEIEGDDEEWEVLRLTSTELWFEDDFKDTWECEID